MDPSDEILTELQFTILDGLADDYEDVEQLYLFANRRLTEENQKEIHFPCMLIEVRLALRDICDEITNMIRDGFIEAKYSNDETIAPLRSVDFTVLHHYWFGPTTKGMKAWRAYQESAKT